MVEDVQEFFAGLPERADRERLAGLTGSYGFELEGTGSWRVDVADGVLTVAEGSTAGAACVVRSSGETFLKILRGEQNPMTAYMTGKVKIEGDTGLLLKLRELLS